MTAHWSDVLVRMGASDFVARWARTQPDLATAWAACPEVDWMLWVVEHTDRDPRHVAIWLCACAMVDRVLVHVPSGEERPHNAVEARRAWCRGEVSDQGLLRAHRDALDSYPRTAYAAEASRAARHAVANDARGDDRAGLTEGLFQIVFCRAVGNAAHVEIVPLY